MHRPLNEPERLKDELLAGVRAHLSDDHLIAEHFTPRYRPWQQRIAFIPEGDLFKSIANGKASVVTGSIQRMVPEGIRLETGEVLKADVVVTATGFNMNVLGDIVFTIDEVPLRFADTVTYRGMMFSGVPNMVWVFGFFRASCTFRADLVAEFVCRLLTHMQVRGARIVVPQLRAEDAQMQLKQWVEAENFNPGYLQRSLHLLPRQRDRAPWIHRQDYGIEKDEIPSADLEDGALRYR
jgi:cation diffusion facilitator CzcD-associated flavoprotein CzcO